MKQLIAFLQFIISNYMDRKRFQNQTQDVPVVVSECLSHIEQAALDILEAQEPVDQAIILWCGLDGLRLNEDGTLDWVSRKKPKPSREKPKPSREKPKPSSQDVFYQPCRSIQPIQSGMLLTGQTQCTKAQIDALMAQNVALQMQAWQSMQITNTIQQCCIQYPIQYPSYYYGGCCGFN